MHHTGMNEFPDSIEIGTAVPPLVKEITRKQLFMYSATTWDYQPGHYNPDFARSQGFPDVYMDGPMMAAFLAQLVTDWVGEHGDLKTLNVSYRGMVSPGDTLTGRGIVASRKGYEITCDVWLENQHGKRAAEGKAGIVLNRHE